MKLEEGEMNSRDLVGRWAVVACLAVASMSASAQRSTGENAVAPTVSVGRGAPLSILNAELVGAGGYFGGSGRSAVGPPDVSGSLQRELAFGERDGPAGPLPPGP